MTPIWSSGWSGWSTRPSTSDGSTRPGRRSARRTSAGTGGCPSPTAGASHARHSGAGRGPAEVVVFISAPQDSPAPDIAAVVRDYAAAGATCVAVNADEDDADIERFAGFLAREVSPLVSAGS